LSFTEHENTEKQKRRDEIKKDLLSQDAVKELLEKHGGRLKEITIF
jgi:hypothetical protein